MATRRNATKTGVRVGGQQYVSPVLSTMVGRKVDIRIDPADNSVLYLYDPSALNGGFLGIAHRLDQDTNRA